jgi:hypothetical protein
MNVVGYGTLNCTDYWVSSLVSRKEKFYSVLKNVFKNSFKIRLFVILGAVDGELPDTFLSSEVLTCARSNRWLAPPTLLK